MGLKMYRRKSKQLETGRTVLTGSRTVRKRICSYIWAVIFILSMTIFTTSITASAASSKNVKTITVRADKKNITKKTYTLEIGKSKSLKVTTSPKQAVKSISYKSNKPKIVAVNKKAK